MEKSKQWLDNSILFDARKASEYWALNRLSENLLDNMDLKDIDFKRSRKKVMLKAILLNLKVAQDQGKLVAYSRNKNDYRHHKRYGFLHFKYKLMIPLIDALEKDGYIRNWKINPGMYRLIADPKMARMQATDKFRQAMREISLERITLHQYDDPVLLKINGKLVNYEDNDITNLMREQLRAYALLVGHTPVKLYSFKDEEPAEGLVEYFPLSIGTSTAPSPSLSSTITKAFLGHRVICKTLECRLYRVFNKSFDQGGRFYGGEYQQMGKKTRSRILINGHLTVELDFSAMHLRMLYHVKGMECREDPYSIPGKPQEFRKLAKLASLIAINAKSPLGATMALNSEIKTDKKNQDLKNTMERIGTSAKEIMGAFRGAHPAIRKYLHSGYGVKLQNKDSMIAADILMHFTVKGIVCLCVHDSFIVEKKHEDELKQTMKEVYKNHMGFDCPIK